MADHRSLGGDGLAGRRIQPRCEVVVTDDDLRVTAFDVRETAFAPVSDSGGRGGICFSRSKGPSLDQLALQPAIGRIESPVARFRLDEIAGVAKRTHGR